MVNWEFFDNQTPSSARNLVDDLRAGATVTPTRGAPLCTFRETARVLAGFNDGRAGAENGTAGAATLAGLRVAHELGMHAPPTDARMAGRNRIRHAPSNGSPRPNAPTRPPRRSQTSRHPARRRMFRRRATRPTGRRTDVPLTPVLSRYWDDPESWTLQTYRRHDGYRAAEIALHRDPDDVIATVKDAGSARPRRRRIPDGDEVGLHSAR